MRPSGFPSQGATCHALIFDVPLEDPQYLAIMENWKEYHGFLRNTMGFTMDFFWFLLIFVAFVVQAT
jgi:hypothetical protein